MKELPLKVVCHATLNGSPLPGVLLMAIFGVIRKNPYQCLFGPTNSEGRASIDRSSVLSEASTQMSLAIMDYEPIIGAFSGHIDVKMMSTNDIERALSAFDMFHNYSHYPDGYREKLTAALDVSSKYLSSPIVLQVDVIAA